MPHKMICLLLSNYYWYILIIIPLDWLYMVILST